MIPCQRMWKPRMVIDNDLDVAELFPYYNENLAETTPLDEILFNLKIWSRKIYYLMSYIFW